MGVVAQNETVLGFHEVSHGFTLFHKFIWLNGRDLSQPHPTKCDVVGKSSQN